MPASFFSTIAEPAFSSPPFVAHLAQNYSKGTHIASAATNMDISLAKMLIEEHKKELSAVEALLTRVDDDRREDERVLRFSKEAMRIQLQHQIDDLRAQESVEVEQLEAASQARRAPLDEKRKSIRARIDGIEESIAHVQNVPVEVLGYIFREVVALEVAPWLLTTVNKSWRKTAITNPWLWSNIHLGGPGQELRNRAYQSKWLVGGIPRTCCGKGLVCRNLDELSYIVDKSGVVPLDVRVDRQVEENEWAVLQHLLGPHLSSRIQSLSMSFVEPKGAAGWVLGPFPLLQKLSYNSTPGSFIKRVMARAYQLKNLTAASLPHDRAKYSFWKTLRTLELGCNADASELNQVVAELPLIEVIKGIALCWPDLHTPTVTLRHIKSIELTCYLPYIARLRLPRLEKLIWFDYNFPYYNISKHLGLSKDPNWSLSLPNLVEIEACAYGEAFAVMLRELPNVHTALLKPIHSWDSENPWVLDLIQSLTGVEDMLCPKLRHLTVKCLKEHKALAEPLVRHLIISRKALGIPFKHFQIIWPSRSGKRDEVVQYALPE